jgi:hypothetical protein
MPCGGVWEKKRKMKEKKADATRALDHRAGDSVRVA